MRLSTMLTAFAVIAATPALAAPGGITFTVIGPVDSAGKVPALNAVPGSAISNVSIPVPLRVIGAGAGYTVTVASQNFGFKGTCVTGYTLTANVAGTLTTLASAATTPYQCGKNTVWVWVFNTPAIPSDLGAATLTGTVTYGTTVVKQVVPITIVK
jgi:hypothetical protein